MWTEIFNFFRTMGTILGVVVLLAYILFWVVISFKSRKKKTKKADK